MKKEKYVYNPNTLSYERHEESSKTKYVRWFSIGSGIAVVLAAGALLGGQFFPSSRERALQQEVSQRDFQSQLINEKIKDMEELLEKLHRRDNQIYRGIMGVDPVDDNLWNAGKGGSEKYAHLQGLSNADLLKATFSKIDKLTGQIAIQAKSYEEVTTLVQNKEEMLAGIPSIRPVKTLIRDIDALSGFGMRIHPIHKIQKMHTGIDFTAPSGTPIYSTGNGTVAEATNAGSGYGQHVIINHGFGYRTLYAHMSVMKVRTGQKVKRGELIGLVGSTDSSTGPHCHYEVELNGQKIDPINYCQDDLTPEEYKKLVESSATPMQSFD
jgi:murein DD-endopeptidase MepM/ murein hydrolase activator NlpD